MAPNTITIPQNTVVSRHSFADVIQNASTDQNSLHATVSFKPGDIISKFHAGITQSYATYLTVQTAVDKHITLRPEFLQYINQPSSNFTPLSSKNSRRFISTSTL